MKSYNSKIAKYVNPPAIIMSALPAIIFLAAIPIASVPEAQAVEIVILGPFRLNLAARYEVAYESDSLS